MKNTLIIQINNKAAMEFLHDLAEKKLITVLENKTEKGKLSAKYRGILNPEEGKSLDEHVKQMRSEWQNT